MTRNMISQFGPTIKSYAMSYGLDWRLILAVMKAESGFLHDAESEKGAYGLMQIMPVTGEEVGRTLNVDDLRPATSNIYGGVFYLRKLYDLFDGAQESDRIRLALAAYNAGVSRIYDAQELAAYLQENPMRWRSVRDALPLLSKRYYTLHKNVWVGEKPKTGWFGGSGQTIAYVDKIMAYYEDYCRTIN